MPDVCERCGSTRGLIPAWGQCINGELVPGLWTACLRCAGEIDQADGEEHLQRRIAQRERARLRSITPRVRYLVLCRDGARCCLCGTTSQRAQLVVDHIVPIAAGGSNELSNLRTLCEPCNGGKGAFAEEQAHAD